MGWKRDSTMTWTIPPAPFGVLLQSVPAAVRQRNLPRAVSLVAHRQYRRREKGRLALPTMRVAGEHPSSVITPRQLVHRVGVVTQRDRGVADNRWGTRTSVQRKLTLCCIQWRVRRSTGHCCLAALYTAFYLMSAICIVCYLSIIAASVGLCLGSATCARLLAMVLLFEVLYFFAIGALWTLPTAGRGIGAATGIANGGLMVQFLLLMPIWIPIVFAFLGLYREDPVPTAGSPTASALLPDGG
jgi:hypothetical protein